MYLQAEKDLKHLMTSLAFELYPRTNSMTALFFGQCDPETLELLSNGMKGIKAYIHGKYGLDDETIEAMHAGIIEEAFFWFVMYGWADTGRIQLNGEVV